MPYILWTLGIVVSAFAGLVATILFQDRIAVLLAKVLRGVWIGEKNRTVSGIWFTYYAVIPDPS